jgi:CRISPR-associated protein Cas2
MTEGYKKLSGYQVVWVWVLFDLPVGTKAERKRATRFRNDLLDFGFEMVQFSVYLRHAWSREKADSFARKVGDSVSRGGTCSGALLHGQAICAKPRLSRAVPTRET